MLYQSLVLLVDGFHNQTHQHRTLRTKFLEIDFLCIVRTVHSLAIVDKVLHFHIEDKRLIGILDIEGVETAVLRNDRHIGLVMEVLYGRLYTDNILSTVSLACNQIGRTQVHITHFRRKEDMHRLIISYFQTVRRYHTVKSQLAAQSVIHVAVLFLLGIDLLCQGQLLRHIVVYYCR